jgi:cobalt/nickel transport system permease protein
MRLEAFGAQGGRAGPLHRLDARVKLLAALAFVVAAVAAPVGSWRLLGTLGLVLAFLIGLSGAAPRTLLMRWAGFVVLVGFLSAMVAPGLAARSGTGVVETYLSVLAKNSLAFLMMLLLAAVTPWRDLLLAMRRLGVPRVLVATLLFMERYLHVLLDELGRMITARRARLFRRRDSLAWGLLTGLLGMLLLRSLERAERVHAAMLARGWDGTIRSLDEYGKKFTTEDTEDTEEEPRIENHTMAKQ